MIGDPVLKQQLDTTVLDVLELCPTCGLEVNGPSLGGAQATLYGVHLARTGLPKANQFTVITVGQPRRGDEEFMEAVNDIPNLAFWRMIHHKDIIPRVPLNVMDHALSMSAI